MINISIKKSTIFLFVFVVLLTIINLLFTYCCLNNPEDIFLKNIELFFSTNAEGNLPTYFSSILILINAVVLFIIGLNANKKYSFYWYLLSFLFLFMSIDEMAMIHEKINNIIVFVPEYKKFFTYDWVSLYLILCLVLVVIFALFFIKLPISTKINMLLAGTVYAIGALGFEVIGGKYDIYKEVFTIYTSTEEMLEMGAMVWFYYTFMQYLYNVKSEQTIKIVR